MSKWRWRKLVADVALSADDAELPETVDRVSRAIGGGVGLFDCSDAES